MHPKEIENILKLTPFERYQYFIRKIADREIAYTFIFSNGDYAISTIDDKKLLPIWSAKEFAELSKTDGWENCIIIELTFDDFEETLFDYIDENNLLLNVFPTDKTGFVVSLEEFARDLKDELEQYQ
ncbi:DUF2750 domain-containing protein [Empedobacter tilapiae]|uniref:DUF2750 domain-containing protein n=1 Tax=Empedobacter tilapiae TaxID=2491114 RepID=A0A4Z1BJV6_9FLAO|nr:DUF2750 domain-containing protein [Empedobacter tilapiae]TGN30027.1 DUF2750 domain-containing protein [Empedobacter tilapiae]